MGRHMGLGRQRRPRRYSDYELRLGCVGIRLKQPSNPSIRSLWGRDELANDGINVLQDSLD
jgi:hypothetical protein